MIILLLAVWPFKPKFAERPDNNARTLIIRVSSIYYHQITALISHIFNETLQPAS